MLDKFPLERYFVLRVVAGNQELVVENHLVELGGKL